KPGGLLSRVREGVDHALGDVNELPNTRPHGALAFRKLNLAVEHVVGLGLAVVYVGRRTELRRDRQLVERVLPSGLLAHGLEGDQHAQQPDGPAPIGIDANGVRPGPSPTLLTATRSCHGQAVVPCGPGTVLRTRREG